MDQNRLRCMDLSLMAEAGLRVDVRADESWFAPGSGPRLRMTKPLGFRSVVSLGNARERSVGGTCRHTPERRMRPKLGRSWPQPQGTEANRRPNGRLSHHGVARRSRARRPRARVRPPKPRQRATRRHTRSLLERQMLGRRAAEGDRRSTRRDRLDRHPRDARTDPLRAADIKRRSRGQT